MPIVTLTTDFGWQDYYLATIKGAILCAHPDLRLVDISHGINNYDIVQAAFLFKHAWRSFPAGSIHLVSVNDYAAPQSRFLLGTHEGHYFIAPDNGLFSLIFDGEGPTALQAIPYPTETAFPLKTAYAEAIAHLAQGQPLEDLGMRAETVEQRITLQPVTNRSQIRGSIIYIDQYENAITNVSRELFERIGKGRAFQLFFKRHDPICGLSKAYRDMPVGEPLCRFNTADCLEIAINMGKAASLLGLKAEDNIQIDFQP